MGTQVVINHWPESQACMECVHGVFVNTEIWYGSDYACLSNKHVKGGECLGEILRIHETDRETD
jgi:hypothetical protein